MNIQTIKSSIHTHVYPIWFMGITHLNQTASQYLIDYKYFSDNIAPLLSNYYTAEELEFINKYYYSRFSLIKHNKLELCKQLQYLFTLYYNKDELMYIVYTAIYDITRQLLWYCSDDTIFNLIQRALCVLENKQEWYNNFNITEPLPSW